MKPGEYPLDTAHNFRFTVRVRPEEMSPEEAFEWMCDDCIKSGYDFEPVRKRGFKIVLRPADKEHDEWLIDMLLASTAKDPVMCLRTVHGYFFFARNW